MSIPICMWSGPRNLSTAMMRSFGARADCSVWDEPFFAPYLHSTGIDHPGRIETLAQHETNPETVAQQCTAQVPTDWYFQKHMPHHMLESFPLEWTRHARHFFLLRDPARVIASYAKGRKKFTTTDLGFAAQKHLFIQLQDITGTAPIIINSSDILKNPEKALTHLCEHLQIPFTTEMLSWDKGPKTEDGAWAPYWYTSVAASTNFAPYDPTIPSVPEEYLSIWENCLPDYETLHARSLKF